MYRFFQRFRFLHYLLAGLMLVSVAPHRLRAGDEDNPKIENVRFEVSGDVVLIYYDLVAPLEKVHKVSVYLKRESDTLFIHRPVNLRGDVGAVVFPGQTRRIIWEFASEFPEGLVGDDFYFVVEADAVQTEESNNLLWIAGGAAVAGGLLVILLLPKKTETPTIPVFPGPPGRPTP